MADARKRNKLVRCIRRPLGRLLHCSLAQSPSPMGHTHPHPLTHALPSPSPFPLPFPFPFPVRFPFGFPHSASLPMGPLPDRLPYLTLPDALCLWSLSPSLPEAQRYVDTSRVTR